MKVKKFVAPTMPEVMKHVRKELGADAVILNSKVVHKGGFLGLFKKRNIEVIAALDPQPAKVQPKESANFEKRNVAQSFPSVSKPDSNGNAQVLNEVRELRKWMEKSTFNQDNLYPVSFQFVYDRLVSQEVKPELAKQIIDPLMVADDNVSSELEVEAITTMVCNEIEKQLQGREFVGIDYSKKIIHLVGPTGVGKTTTIAKLAANSVLKDNKRVAFITTDTYRIAAIDQLKTYSKILNIPLEIAYSLEDYQKACDKFRDYDLILVDTAGRNFRNQKYVEELQQMTNYKQEVDTYLVLSLTTRSNDLEEIVQQFQHVPIKQFVFTKKDETRTYGSILNLCLEKGIGVAYITTGQDVPDDIANTTVPEICQMIVGEPVDE
ncbi:flagellar biosynthesis protein FlhF [Aquibacillus sediminis]|uniref:flagellar biosynthesis protein FlhF n=1 Tax=Aquibacillus sediminis TaxID=2574734 RepID=UPI001109BC31|nr:flagellar biosynthesis protein FlhF [Aquibacillus sediminis]